MMTDLEFSEFLAELATKPHTEPTGRYRVRKGMNHWEVIVPGFEWAHPYTFDTWEYAFAFAHARARNSQHG